MSVTVTSPTAGMITFTAPRQSHQPSVRLTKNPIELGANVTDHAKREPDVLVIEAAISETPIANSPMSGRFAPVRAFRDFFEQSVGQLLTIITDRMGTFEKMMITGWPHDTTVIRGTTFALTFEEVRLASANVVSVPPTQPTTAAAQAGFSDQVDNGEQPTTAIDQDDPSAAQDQSILLSLLGGN